MREIRSNINIIGGGLIGLATAYSLSKLDYEITILEKKPPYDSVKHIDYRTVAISEGTKNFLNKIELWKEIKKFAEPIQKISVIDRKQTNKLEFDNKRRVSNLGYIVKNRDLLDILYKKIKKIKKITILNNVSIDGLSCNKESIITSFKNTSIKSEINIAADGKNSYVKNLYKTPFYKKNYDRHALVLTFTHSKNHMGTAFEFFYKNGPLAILPMKKSKGNFLSSIVWTDKKSFIDNLYKFDEKRLISILDKETQNSVGNIKKILSKQVFPLTAHLNTKFYEKRTIYIGDSAHSFHPIAGQGWNLGMRDVENLFNLVKLYKSTGIELGGNSFCKEYHNINFYNAYRLYQITDKLDNIFQIQNPIIYFFRAGAINLIQKNKRIKNIISDFAMGLS